MNRFYFYITTAKLAFFFDKIGSFYLKVITIIYIYARYIFISQIESNMRNKTKLFIFLALFFVSAVAQGQDSLKIIFAGDLMGHGGQIKAAQTADGRYDYSPCWKFIKDYVQSSDLAIANFELTLAGPPYKGYPQFSSPDQVLVDACNAGFDIFTTVNNHCMDGGKKGFMRTLYVFDSLGVPHLGTYRNTEEREKGHPMMVERNGFKLGLVTYTYGTNGLPVPDPLVVNMIDTAQMKADLAKAKELGAEYRIALIHWGEEYHTKANAEQEMLAKLLLDNGADIVIGGHPHVVQNATMDALPENDITPQIAVYSMGNLVSNQRDINTDGGIMIELTLKKNAQASKVSGNQSIQQECLYMPYWVYRGEYDGLYQYYILPSNDACHNPEKYQLPPADLKALTVFDENTRLRLQGQLKERLYYWMP